MVSKNVMKSSIEKNKQGRIGHQVNAQKAPGKTLQAEGIAGRGSVQKYRGAAAKRQADAGRGHVGR